MASTHWQISHRLPLLTSFPLIPPRTASAGVSGVRWRNGYPAGASNEMHGWTSAGELAPGGARAPPPRRSGSGRNRPGRRASLTPADGAESGSKAGQRQPGTGGSYAGPVHVSRPLAAALARFPFEGEDERSRRPAGAARSPSSFTGSRGCFALAALPSARATARLQVRRGRSPAGRGRAPSGLPARLCGAFARRRAHPCRRRLPLRALPARVLALPASVRDAPQLSAAAVRR